MDTNPSLGQLSVAHPDEGISPEVGTEVGEAVAEELVVEDLEVGIVGSMEAGGIELEEHPEGSVGEERGSERVDVAEDTRLDCWDWPHNWEDLDWDEAMWVEDETVSADIEEAALSDELWE
jgi:hypothetical protein